MVSDRSFSTILNNDYFDKRTYAFIPVKKPILTKHTVKEILRHAMTKSISKLKVTLDLGLSTSHIAIEDGVIVLPYNERIQLDKMASCVNELNDDDVLVIMQGNIYKIAFSAEGNFYKLKAVGPRTAPTLEINGIHMHRIVGITPWKDSLLKIRYARIKRCVKVLDVCTGLGYTAIASLLRGACKVVTVEIDEYVLKIASYNPWSWKLSSDRIMIINDDATEVVSRIKDSSFDRIIHDPPILPLAGELYSKEFYKELFRILKKGGILFHYTGKPGHSRGINITKGVTNRLRQVGFEVKIAERASGVVAFKPRSK